MKKTDNLLLTGFIFVSLMYALTFNSQMSWRIFLFIFFFLAISYFSVLSPLKYFIMTPLTPVMVEVGEKREIEFKLLNTSKRNCFFPLLTITCPDLDYKETYYLFSKKDKRLIFVWEAKKRMSLEKVTVEIKSSDLFGLINKRQQLDVEFELAILPSSHGEVNYQQVTQLFEKTLFGERSFDVENIREYQAGDSIKGIDWKLSSKKQILMLREYKQQQLAKTVFIFYGVKSFYFEKSLQVFFSLFQSSKNYDWDFYLMGDNVSQKKIDSPIDFARIKKASDPGSFTSIKEQNIIVITPEVTSKLTKELCKFNQTQKVTVIDYQMIESELIRK
ncbi:MULTISPECIES: DUF58 domain-containing protein [Vagococcus]|uniref:DUF58 domain-containing protein n=1 Tax=Vagococcus fluvialis bH819 TaxID=1255619 RepID=A0A1X6WKB9_9ENTE|nr:MULTISPECIES: DUF58 domain-containing protein [Vagococcus]SLM84771.1 hypothetical protein FM121_01665 [Vagococcus fluvialis bH819]HCM89769.1 DUF58 domain-containing protein [Vagococcus sp.]